MKIQFTGTIDLGDLPKGTAKDVGTKQDFLNYLADCVATQIEDLEYDCIPVSVIDIDLEVDE